MTTQPFTLDNSFYVRSTMLSFAKWYHSGYKIQLIPVMFQWDTGIKLMEAYVDPFEDKIKRGEICETLTWLALFIRESESK